MTVAVLQGIYSFAGLHAGDTYYATVSVIFGCQRGEMLRTEFLSFTLSNAKRST